ncbi:MAG: UDP-N-acetylmuramate dehydrogenase [Bacteroidales bacterium]|nr:UDP-N-acetylmuramate dehydrogenase [Bacteroidales bacterium]
MITITTNASLKEHNTFGLSPHATILAEYDNVEALKAILDNEIVKQHNHKLWNIGKGSNILFSGNFEGVILHGKIKGITITEDSNNEATIKIGAGETWDDIVEWAVQHELYGAENLSLIPGEVGAAAVQNIGAYGAEFCDLVVSVEALNTETHELENIAKEDCLYGYRESIFKRQPYKNRYIITAVTIKLSKTPQFNLEYGNVKSALEGKEINLRNVREAIVEIRTKKLPDWKVLGNAGSFFKNPVISIEHYNSLKTLFPTMPSYNVKQDDKEMVKVPAGWLIENAGLKGFRHGGAQVYEKQCLVLVNTGNATPSDIVELATTVIDKVKEKFEIEISPEVNIL